MTTFLISMQIILVTLEIVNVFYTLKKTTMLAENTRITKSIKSDLDDDRNSKK